MRAISIQEATELYDGVSACEITRHSVDHTGLAAFSNSLRSFLNSIAGDSDDEFWQRALGPIRRLAFALCSTPIPFASLAEAIPVDWKRIDRLVLQSQDLYPDSHEPFRDLVSSIRALILETDSPLVPPLEELLKQHGTASVVLRNSRLNSLVAKHFSNARALRGAKIVGTSQLRGSVHCDVLVPIGPCGWFPEYVFTAPRARAIHVISFRWIRDGWTPGPRFLSAPAGTSENASLHRLGSMPRVSANGTQMAELGDLAPHDILPQTRPISEHTALRSYSQNESSGDSVPARLCQLGDTRGVFVSADDGAKLLIIDPSETGNVAVRRVPIEQLEPGMYLLLRTSGAGDLIAPLADRILGASSESLRAQQAEWKERVVSAAVQRFGNRNRHELSSLICGELNASGLSDARPENVHYWICAKCIRPRDQEDFGAVLAFAGMESRAGELWEAMGQIDRAHRKAGHLIRQMLLRAIGETSMETLERDGDMVFELGDQDGGSLSAFLITEVFAKDYEVAPDRIGVLLDFEDELWPE